jgi:hypothetical protein
LLLSVGSTVQHLSPTGGLGSVTTLDDVPLME